MDSFRCNLQWNWCQDRHWPSTELLRVGVAAVSEIILNFLWQFSGKLIWQQRHTCPPRYSTLDTRNKYTRYLDIQIDTRDQSCGPAKYLMASFLLTMAKLGLFLHIYRNNKPWDTSDWDDQCNYVSWPHEEGGKKQNIDISFLPWIIWSGPVAVSLFLGSLHGQDSGQIGWSGGDRGRMNMMRL